MLVIVEDLDSVFPSSAPLDDAGLAFLSLLKLIRDTATPRVHLVRTTHRSPIFSSGPYEY